MELPKKCHACGASAWSFETQCIQCGASLALPAIEDEIQPVPAKRNDTDSVPEADDRSGFRRTGLLCAIAAVACFAVLPKWRPVFVVLLIGTPLTVVFVAANAIAARLYRVPCIGFGVWSVPLAVFRIGRCVVKVGALPNPSAYAKLAGFDDLPPTSPVDIREGERRYDELHPFQRLLILLAGPAMTLFIAIALLGWPEGWNSMVRGFEQRWMSCWSPRLFAQDVLAPFLRRVQSADYRYVLGSIAAKQTAENMYPIPVATGGLAVLELWHLVTGRKVRPRTRIILQCLGLAVLLWLFIAMCIATYTAVAAL